MSSQSGPTRSVLTASLAGLAGAIDVEQTPMGHVPLRLSLRALPTVADPLVAALARMPAGIRIRVRTDAPWIDVSCLLTLVGTPAGLQPAAFEVVTEGRSTATVISREGNVVMLAGGRGGIASYQPGSPTVVRLPLEDSGVVQTYEIWLPHGAQVAISDIAVPATATVEADPDSRERWLHYGSSISHCMGAPRPSAAWPSVAAAALGLSLTNLGFSGQCHVDQFVARSISDTACDLISLKLGANIVTADSMRERTFVSAVHGFLDTIRDGHPEVPVVLISPIICPVLEHDPGPTRVDDAGQVGRDERPDFLAEGALSLERVRQLLDTVVEVRRSHGDVNLHGVSGLDILGANDTGLLGDGLHPVPAAWPTMGQRASELIRGLAVA